jgi:hypothetical protein
VVAVAVAVVALGVLVAVLPPQRREHQTLVAVAVVLEQTQVRVMAVRELLFLVTQIFILFPTPAVA